MRQFSDETLMAFADGMLDEPEFSAVAQAVEADPAVAERLQALVEGASLVRSGFAPLLQPVPAALEASVRAAVAKAGAAPWWRRIWDGLELTLPGAAAVACGIALIALPAGYGLGQFGRPTSPMETPAGPGLEQALASLPSGDTAEIGNGIAVVPVATFTDGTGKLCREYETSGAAAYIAVACRLENTWQTQFMVATGGDEQAYRPASGLAAVDAYLDAIGAGPVLLDEQEAVALRAGR